MSAPDYKHLQRYFREQATLEEAQEVLTWLATAEGQRFYSAYLDERIRKESTGANLTGEVDIRMVIQTIESQTRQPKQLYPYYTVAAAIVLLLLAGAVFWINRTPEWSTLSTVYGETQSVALADGTQVILNANSVMRYRTEDPREVWLEGEAFFQVKHTEADAPFHVNTSDLVVYVLGTEFNVNTRRAKTDVVLNQGKVVLSLPANNADSTVEMQPGDRVRYSKAKQTVEKQIANPQVYTAWTQGTMILNHTPLREVFQRIEDIYGVRVEASDPSVLGQELSGQVDQDLELIILLIEKSFDITITHRANVLYLN
ncbi:FecR family protein [Tunicatimonas pelagia]|uniref:FecR family protein n=1 Tax=Tunicatimonas pelagia TaxID=931531 RepID=UPI002666035B|nr:FecR domain-containing protein [Tunicatimonas pelagia]WKN44992.1 FecR domain-containing protein [Tunicatimonas pelagia]